MHHAGVANEVAGLLFNAVGILYGALLAFIVFATWESFSAAQAAVTAEAADLVGVYRDTQQFPEPVRGQVQLLLRSYPRTVMDVEWASHGSLKAHTAPDLLNPVWNLYRSMTPPTADEQAELRNATERLHDLELQRHLRHLSSEATLPDIFWPLLLVGALTTVLFSYFIEQNSLRAQAVMTALVAALLAGVLILIFSLNLPFTGPVQVSKGPLLHALSQFDALDMK